MMLVRNLQGVELSSNTVYRHPERGLGFEYELLLPQGVPATETQMIVVPNSRPTIVDDKIERFWEQKMMPENANRDVARFERAIYDGERLEVYVSREKYKTHFFLRTTPLPKEYQAQALSINGILITKDRKIVTGIRNPRATDQGRIECIAPAGFLDTIELPIDNATEILRDELYLPQTVCSQLLESDVLLIPESPFSAARKELREELKDVAYNDMKILGVIHNSRKNFDTTIAILMTTTSSSSEIKPKGEEHEELCFTDVSPGSLEEKLYELSRNPETNSGHLRGCLAALYAHKYGLPAHDALIEKTLQRLTD